MDRNTAFKLLGASGAVGGLIYLVKKRKEANKAHLLEQSHGIPHTQETTMKTRVLELSGHLLESFKPITNIHAHLCAFHCYHDDRSRQLPAHHYCSHITEDVMQCLIYDRDDIKEAKLIGVEYVISAEIFSKLPDSEKKYWHPHVYEVKSGQMIVPHVPGLMEDRMMGKLVDTYGKTWHFWQVDRGDALPLGEPKLMSTFYGPGQLSEKLWKERDRLYDVAAEKIVSRRANMQHHPIDPKASA